MNLKAHDTIFWFNEFCTWHTLESICFVLYIYGRVFQVFPPPLSHPPFPPPSFYYVDFVEILLSDWKKKIEFPFLRYRNWSCKRLNSYSRKDQTQQKTSKTLDLLSMWTQHAPSIVSHIDFFLSFSLTHEWYLYLSGPFWLNCGSHHKRALYGSLLHKLQGFSTKVSTILLNISKKFSSAFQSHCYTLIQSLIIQFFLYYAN